MESQAQEAAEEAAAANVKVDQHMQQQDSGDWCEGEGEEAQEDEGTKTVSNESDQMDEEVIKSEETRKDYVDNMT